MEPEQHYSDHFLSYLEKRYFEYEEHSCTVIDITVNKDLTEFKVVRQSRKDPELRLWIQEVLHHGTNLTKELGFKRQRWGFTSPYYVSNILFSIGYSCLHLRMTYSRLAPRINDDPTISLLQIPFSKDTFRLIMEKHRLPKTLLHTIGREHTLFSGILSNEMSDADWNGCVMRMGAIAGYRDLAAAISWSKVNNSTYVLLLGCEPADMKTIETLVTYSRASIGHPLLFLAGLADLQLKRYEDLHRSSDHTLTRALFNAGLARTVGEEVLIAPNQTAMEDLEVDHDNLNRDVLHSYKTAGSLCQCLLRFKAQLSRITKIVRGEEKGYSQMATNMVPERARETLGASLELTSETVDDLIEKSRLTTNMSSLLMSAIFNLIAQKENKINQKLAKESKEIAEQSAMIASESKRLTESSQRLAAESKSIAEDSREIAKATKRDSTSMKAIAMLTMVFIPATFASTVLSMPMFDWDRKPGERLIAYDNFRVYLATALPMTAVVMIAWITWMCWPRKGPIK